MTGSEINHSFLFHRVLKILTACRQGLTGRAFQLRVGYGSGIGKNISGRFGYGLGTGICII